MKLTKNFSLSEFGFGAKKPTAMEIRTCYEMSRLILQPMRDHVGSTIVLTSGYRSPAHNKKIGGSETSQHMYRQIPDDNIYDAGVDINFKKYMENHAARLDFFEFARSELSNVFSQCIWYTGTRHFHIGLYTPVKNGQCLIKHGPKYLPNNNRADIVKVDDRLK